MKNKVLRKLGIGALTLGILGVGTSAYAGTWDWADQEAYISFKKGQTYDNIRYAASTGGDFKVKFEGVDGDGFYFDLVEYDPGDNPDETVKSKIRVKGDGEFIFRDIGKYVDGSNKQAEFQAKMYGALTDQKNVKVTYYD